MVVTRELIRLAKFMGISAGISLFVVNELGMIAKVEGNSMQPSFNPLCGQKNEDLRYIKNMTRQELTKELKTRVQQDRVIMDKFSVARDKTKLRVGDVVILTSPKDPSKTLIKRITAMPGDTIEFIETGEVKVIDEGHCWVEGDNQQYSYDSNNFGQVPLGLVQGRVCFIIWPIRRFGKVKCDPSISSHSTYTSVGSSISKTQVS